MVVFIWSYEFRSATPCGNYLSTSFTAIFQPAAMKYPYMSNISKGVYPFEQWRNPVKNLTTFFLATNG
jgi:hypothetical protein